jgi:hypothetical protein
LRQAASHVRRSCRGCQCNAQAGNICLVAHAGEDCETVMPIVLRHAGREMRLMSGERAQDDGWALGRSKIRLLSAESRQTE